MSNVHIVHIFLYSKGGVTGIIKKVSFLGKDERTKVSIRPWKIKIWRTQYCQQLALSNTIRGRNKYLDICINNSLKVLAYIKNNHSLFVNIGLEFLTYGYQGKYKITLNSVNVLGNKILYQVGANLALV